MAQLTPTSTILTNNYQTLQYMIAKVTHKIQWLPWHEPFPLSPLLFKKPQGQSMVVRFLKDVEWRFEVFLVSPGVPEQN